MNLLRQKYFCLIVLFILSCIPLLDLLHPGIPFTHDLQDHVARIANFYTNLTQGNLIPRWAGNLNWGYGTPILMFLYPLPSYFASFFHVIGFSLEDSVKIVFGIAFIASAFSMYLWVNEFLGNTAGIIAGTLYTLAPYRFVDIYVRGDIGENLAFVFPPLALYFLLRLSKKRSYGNFVGVSLSVALLILAHNAFAVMFLPIIVLYLLFLTIQNKWDKYFFISAIASVALGIGLSAFFLIPAYFEGKYTLRDVVTGTTEIAKSFVRPFQFLWMSWSYGATQDLTKQVGIAQWFALFVSGITVWKLRKKEKFKMYLYISLIIIFLSTLFLMTQYSYEIWYVVRLLQKFQFPWRFLAIVVFTTAVFGGYAVSCFKNKKLSLVLGVSIVAIAFFQNSLYFRAVSFKSNSESFYTGIYNGTTDTGESSPWWSVRFMEKRPKTPVEIISGSAKVQEGFRKMTEHRYTVIVNQFAQLRENILYFPGWKVFVDGSPVSIQYQDTNNRGVMTFFVPSGTHTVDVRFMNTKLRTLSDYLSAISLILLIGLGIWYKKIYGSIS